MEFFLYKRINELALKATGYAMVLIALGCFALIRDSKYTGRSTLDNWEVPGQEQNLILVVAILLLIFGFKVGFMSPTRRKILFDNDRVMLIKSKRKNNYQELTSSIVTIKPDFQKWMYNDQWGNAWKVDLKYGKTIRFLVPHEDKDGLENWIKHNLTDD